jgi:hypothetical protein
MVRQREAADMKKRPIDAAGFPRAAILTKPPPAYAKVSSAPTMVDAPDQP